MKHGDDPLIIYRLTFKFMAKTIHYSYFFEIIKFFKYLFAKNQLWMVSKDHYKDNQRSQSSSAKKLGVVSILVPLCLITISSFFLGPITVEPFLVKVSIVRTSFSFAESITSVFRMFTDTVSRLSFSPLECSASHIMISSRNNFNTIFFQ